jgi:hypothetical protein
MPALWSEVNVHPDGDEPETFFWHIPVAPAGVAGVVFDDLELPDELVDRLSVVWYPQSVTAHLQLGAVRADEVDALADAIDRVILLAEQSHAERVAARTTAFEQDVAAERRRSDQLSSLDEEAETIAARLRRRALPSQ